MATVGYCRVSTQEQNLDIQLDKLKKYGVTKIFTDKVSGATSHRKGLQDALNYVREGDTLVVTRLDRLARSVSHLLQISERLKADGVNLVVLDQSIDTTTSAGKLMFSMLGAVAEFERDLLRERVKEGVAKAQQKGVKFGRPKALTNEQKKELVRLRVNEGASVPDLMKRFGISRDLVFKCVREHKTAMMQESKVTL